MAGTRRRSTGYQGKLLYSNQNDSLIFLLAYARAEVRATHKLIVDHINKIREENSVLRHATAVMILESNLAFESQHILHALSEAGVHRWLALAEGPGGSLGLLTTAGRKEEYTLLLREAMRMSKISMAETFFSMSMGKAAYLKRLEEELLNFSCITEEPKTTFGKSRKTYTGKLAGCAHFTVIVHSGVSHGQSCCTGSKTTPSSACKWPSTESVNFSPTQSTARTECRTHHI